MLGPAGTGRSQHNLTLGLVVVVENVLRLEISVYNTTLVEILDSGEKLGHHRGCLGLGETSLLTQTVKHLWLVPSLDTTGT